MTKTMPRPHTNTMYSSLFCLLRASLSLCCRIEHLSLNMAMQLLVGVPLEMVHGAMRIGLVYVCGVLAGGPSSHIRNSFII